MGYAKFNKKDNSSMITFVGNIVPATTETSSFLILEDLMRLQSSAKRVSYNDIIKRGLDRKSSTSKTAELFINNVRYMRDAFVLAEQTIESQKALLPEYLSDKIKSANSIQNKIDKLSKAKRAKFKNERLAKLKTKLKKRQKSIAFLESHIVNNTVPSAVFGGAKNVELLKLKKITNDEWKQSRRNSLYSIGEKSKNGNENIKLTFLHDNYFEISILNPLSQKKGDRIKFLVKFPEKMVSYIANHLLSKESYTVRVMKETNGTYSVHITMSSLTALDNGLFKLGMAGIDINPDNISLAIVDANGNFRASQIFKFPEINYVSSNKRNIIIENTVKKIINVVKNYKVGILTIEDLKFKNSYQNNSDLNRMLSNFVHSKIVNAVGSRCYKEGIILKKVNPAYTSLLGRIKYQKRFGLSVHESAAICIARKGLGLKEKLPKKLLTDFFAMEVKDKIKISDAKYKEFLNSLYSFFTDSHLRKSINKINRYFLIQMGIKRHPREWLFEDYLKYAEVYITKLLERILVLKYTI